MKLVASWRSVRLIFRFGELALAAKISAPVPIRDDQCRPTDDQQMRRPGHQSVCRQCFATCDQAGSNGRYCLHHGSNDALNNGDPSLVAGNINSMKINQWSNQDAALSTYYDLEDNSTGGRTV